MAAKAVKRGYKRQVGSGDVQFIQEGAFPLDTREKEAWGTGVAWEEALYIFAIRGIGGRVEENGNRTAIVDFECLKGPDDDDKFKGEHFVWFRNIYSKKKDSEKSANFFLGFLKQVCPEGLLEKNLLVGPKGVKNPAMEWWSGAVISLRLTEEAAGIDEETGKERFRMQPGQFQLITSSSYAQKKLANKDKDEGGNSATDGEEKGEAASEEQFFA